MPDSTIGGRWDAANGRPAGFDYLRITLAAAVILMHAPPVSYGHAGALARMAAFDALVHPIFYFVLPAFFALSGFLVAGSLQRNDLVSFAALRVIRIFPALMAEVIICALIIGPIFTVLSLGAYVSDPRFAAYFLNMAGVIHYKLPGVFLDLPFPQIVNAQLWTVPIELQCYVTLIVFALLGLHRRVALFLASAVAITMALLAWNLFTGDWPAFSQPATARILILNFLFGVFFYLVRDRVPVTGALFAVALAAFVALSYSGVGVYLTPVLSAYATIAVGLTNARVAPLIELSNSSYGVYLYGFPVQQVVASVFPQHRVWWFNFLVSLVATTLVGALSWRLLEVKFADRKKPILAGLQRALGVGRRAARAALPRAMLPVALRVSARVRASAGTAPEARDPDGRR